MKHPNFETLGDYKLFLEKLHEHTWWMYREVYEAMVSPGMRVESYPLYSWDECREAAYQELSHPALWRRK